MRRRRNFRAANLRRGKKSSYLSDLKSARKKSWWDKLSVSRFNVVAAVLVFAMIVCNLVALNSITANGYKLKKIESQILELNNENQNLSLDLSDKQSIEEVIARAGDLGMVEAGHVSYITAPSTAVAKK
ncbi:hypothetical protein ACFL29_01095 [Patescibacteria group bacterium]